MISSTKKKRKWHRNKLSKKRIVRVAGLRKGRGKEFGRTRAHVREGNKKGPLPFSLPPPPNLNLLLSLSKAYRTGQEKDSKRLELLSARLIAKKICEHVELKCARLTSQLHWKTELVFDPRLHDLQILVLCVHGESKPFSGCLTRQYKPPLYLA